MIFTLPRLLLESTTKVNEVIWQIACMRKIINAYKIVFGIKSSDLCLHFNTVITFIQIIYENVDWKVVCSDNNNTFYITVQYGAFIDQFTRCQLLKK
jgi:hypothetical protein